MKPLPHPQVSDPQVNDSDHNGSGAPPYWLDTLLREQAAQARPADGDFSAGVLAALPAARVPRAAYPGARSAGWLRLAVAAAAGLCAAAVVALAPPALALLASTPHPADWLVPGMLEGLLPPLALAAWLSWWSVRQAQAGD